MKLIINNENVLNVPNVLSAYRLLMFPFILYSIYDLNERLYIILLLINLVTDILDGFIARRYKLVTKFGASLDNMADFGTYILAVLGMVIFKWEFIQPHALILWVFLSVFTLTNIISWIKFRKMPGLHLYSCVSAGYLQGIFFVVLFLFGFKAWLFYLSMGWAVLGYIEKTFVLFAIDDIAPGTKGLYWVMKRKTAKL